MLSAALIFHHSLRSHHALYNHFIHHTAATANMADEHWQLEKEYYTITAPHDLVLRVVEHKKLSGSCLPQNCDRRSSLTARQTNKATPRW